MSDIQPVGANNLLKVDIKEKTFRSARGKPVTALRDLQFDYHENEFTCIFGPSGCGKTTTLRILLGLEKEFKGSFELPKAESSKVGAVFQEPNLLPWRTVDQNVRLAMPKGEREKDLGWLFNSLGLKSMLELYPSELSLGLARRVSIARAFAIEPDILFLDEPFVSLDDPTAERLRRLLLSVWSERPTTALMVTHNLQEALMLCDRILVMSERPGHLRGTFDVKLPRESRSPLIMNDLLRSFHNKFPAMG